MDYVEEHEDDISIPNNSNKSEDTRLFSEIKDFLREVSVSWDTKTNIRDKARVLLNKLKGK